MRPQAVSLFAACAAAGAACAGVPKTAFQTSSRWTPEIDVPAECAIVYGAGDGPAGLAARAKSWKDRGYSLMYMTGASWGAYSGYFNPPGGAPRTADMQTRRDGSIAEHSPGIPYAVPSADYLRYVTEHHIRPAIDAGIADIVLEEPEYWTCAGYSEAFKRAWQREYGEPWSDPALSADAAWRAAALMRKFYADAAGALARAAKAYGRTKGVDVEFHVATHSPFNYPFWGIAAPGTSLAADPDIDGFIVQVWTGTARAPGRYRSAQPKERIFETAFIEYASALSMLRAGAPARPCRLLTDPIEDAARDWGYYRLCYQAVFAAQLIAAPQCDLFEVMPWPRRIYTKPYKAADGGAPAMISRDYAVQMQTMINALGDIPAAPAPPRCGVAVAMSDTMMYQRSPLGGKPCEDGLMGSFTGLAMPFLKRGVPVDFLFLEHADKPGAFDGIDMLLMSYDGMKPPSAACHAAIADWVRAGGMLVFCSGGSDAYSGMKAWWNGCGKNGRSAAGDLFARLGMPETPQAGIHLRGKGAVSVVRGNPGEISADPVREAEFFRNEAALFKIATRRALEVKNHFTVRRGPYLCAAVMDESVSAAPLELKGLFIDLFDPALGVVESKSVPPGAQAFLYDLRAADAKKTPAVLCGSAWISGAEARGGAFRFAARAPAGTDAVLRVLLPSKPERVLAGGKPLPPEACKWHEASKTLLISFPASPAGVQVEMGIGTESF